MTDDYSLIDKKVGDLSVPVDPRIELSKMYLLSKTLVAKTWQQMQEALGKNPEAHIMLTSDFKWAFDEGRKMLTALSRIYNEKEKSDKDNMVKVYEVFTRNQELDRADEERLLKEMLGIEPNATNNKK